MDITKRMLDFRAKNDLSIEKAAMLAGITKQTWAHVERGLQDPSRLTEAKIMMITEGEEPDDNKCE